jgi:hypothetical protein
MKKNVKILSRHLIFSRLFIVASDSRPPQAKSRFDDKPADAAAADDDDEDSGVKPKRLQILRLVSLPPSMISVPLATRLVQMLPCFEHEPNVPALREVYLERNVNAVMAAADDDESALSSSSSSFASSFSAASLAAASAADASSFSSSSIAPSPSDYVTDAVLYWLRRATHLSHLSLAGMCQARALRVSWRHGGNHQYFTNHHRYFPVHQKINVESSVSDMKIASRKKVEYCLNTHSSRLIANMYFPVDARRSARSAACAAESGHAGSQVMCGGGVKSRLWLQLQSHRLRSTCDWKWGNSDMCTFIYSGEKS